MNMSFFLYNKQYKNKLIYIITHGIYVALFLILFILICSFNLYSFDLSYPYYLP